MRRDRIIGWLAANWVAGAGFLAVGLLALAPLLGHVLGAALLLLHLHGPAYMLHQVEEHAGDRFRRFANRALFGGREVLTPGEVLLVNLPLVWGGNLAALYAGFAWGVGYGLAAPYLVLVNALTHLGAALRLRRPNPGLATAVLLFLPLGGATLRAAAGQAAPWQHALGLAIALLVHALIVADAMRRWRRLAGVAPALTP
ncbi:HXXEE domain-containing protein [Roseomonas sp. NAR14]|uniref:HXXEE domain-containing protein n=1 Tax=Roseomonas acroporae TaxID=2937791 RepID=A0A9X1Y9J9_9PROT|nr:HXXEE domain-containing protein [Roseomonas acroporae]MCK8786399.1 HXXEE domain-containing protein [Roseomonas acroporae]